MRAIDPVLPASVRYALAKQERDRFVRQYRGTVSDDLLEEAACVFEDGFHRAIIALAKAGHIRQDDQR